MFTLFVLGSLWSWILFIVVSILIIAAVENNSSGWATMAIFSTIILLFCGGEKQSFMQLFSWISVHPIYTIFYIIGYFIMGTIWSIVKWYFYLLKRRESYLSNISNVYIESISRNGVLSVTRNKSRILSWMIYWPFSFIWTMIDQPIKTVFNYIFNRIVKIYDTIFIKIFPESLDK